MFDIVRNNRRIVQLFLALITLPFVFWGVDSYVRNASSGTDAASVGGSKITLQEFERALRDQQERMRPALGGKVDPAMLDNPQLRRAVLDNLVTQRLLALQAAKARLSVSDQDLAQFIASAPALQENGKFSPQRYEMLVAAQGMSKEMFEARVRQDMAMQQMLMAVSGSTLPGRVATDRWIGAQLEEREIAEAVLRPEQYAAQVKLAPDAVKNFYEANRKRFEVPEQARAEFVVLSQDKLATQAPTDEEIKAYYEAHADRFKMAEERRASHILITAPKDAPAAADKAARSRAEEVLAQVKKNPGDFAKLAKQYSQDPGSAERGGDLDWFGRGAMVPPFEQAVFALKENEVSGIVRSDFGYHIIKLTGIRPERVKPLAEAKAEIVDELKRENAAKKYGEAAEGFTNTVYEQSDSLKPVADKYKLDIRSTDWIAKNGQKPLPPFDNAKLLTALFADDAVKNKRNTEAVEVAPNTLVSARIVDYKPAALQPLETVAPAIEKLLVRQEAAKLAAKDGENKLALLAKGEKVDLAWSSPRVVARAYAPNLAPDAVRAVFKADVAKLPAYAGAANGDGYALYRISQDKPYTAGAEEPQRAKALREQYRRAVAEEEFSAWMETLRKRFPVDINKSVLEAKDK